MIPDCYNETGYMLMYSVLMWILFTLAFYLADSLFRWKTSMVSALLNLVLVSVVSMLGAFAAAELKSGLLMSSLFQLAGVFLCSMAVSRAGQMLSWPRTWLVSLYCLLAYLAAGMILTGIFLFQHS